MKYISTRTPGQAQTPSTQRTFSEILLEGLAPDGGLYVPTQYPRIDEATLAHWRTLAYPALAFEILSLFIDDIPAQDLRRLTLATYNAQVFGSDLITPLKALGPGMYLQALSNGPTLAFKDIAMQLLGNMFEYALARRGEKLNILGATSGDTGSAAEYAMRGKAGIAVFMLSPHGRMSPFQQAQMYSLQDPNIYNIAIEGVFDDCQDIVKAVSGDAAFKQAHNIGTVNSINWARLLAQVVYYFYGYFQATQSNAQRVSFAVPTGNFGNICAGHVARMMGLPIHQLVLATNENNVLDEFFRTGTYRVRTSAQTLETSSPSMDISKASNFERFIFDVMHRKAADVNALFGRELAEQGFFTLPRWAMERIQEMGIVSGTSSHQNRLDTIRSTWEKHQNLIDPHTADGLRVAYDYQVAGVPMIVLETAQPAKFEQTVFQATAVVAPRPALLEGIEALPKRFAVLPVSVEQVKNYLAQQAMA